MSAHATDGNRQSMLGRLETLTAVAIVGVLALALGLAALAVPSTTTTSQTLAFSQAGSFNYSAAAPSTSIYGAKGLTSGQAIVAKLVGPVKVAFDYTLSSDAPVDVKGSAALGVTVDLGRGFSKSFPVATTQQFAGRRATVRGVLPLAAIRAYTDSAARDLGNAVPATETVTLRPKISVSGAIGGHTLQPTTFAPNLAFTMNDGTLDLASQSAATGSAASAEDQLNVKQSGSIKYHASHPNTLSLLVLHPQVHAAMIGGFAIAALCLLLCLWLARPLRAGKSPGDRERIRTLYGSQLVPVDSLAIPQGPIADVATIESLADLAKRYESMIMHVEHADADIYLVWDNGMLYRFRASHEPGVDAETVDEVIPAATSEDVRGASHRVNVEKRKRDQRELADISTILDTPSYLQPMHTRVAANGIDGDSLGDDLVERLFNGQKHRD